MNHSTGSDILGNQCRASGAATVGTKKMQQPHPVNSKIPWATPPSAAETTSNAAQKAMLASKRRQSSIPNMPSGPHALESSAANKRTVNPPANVHLSTISGASAMASRDPYTHQLSINDISRFTFASIPPQKIAPKDEPVQPLDFGDFLAPVNFDEFHNSIASTEPSLNHFPLPGRGGPKPMQDTREKKTAAQPSIPTPVGRKVSGSASLGRKGSGASIRNLPKPEAMSMTSSNSILKGRRQSHFPPNAFQNSNGKAPRKSVDPETFLPPDATGDDAPQWRPSMCGRKPSAEKQKDNSLPVGPAARDQTGVDAKEARATSSARTTDSALRPDLTSKPLKGLLQTPRTPDTSRAPLTNTAGTPGKVARSITPGTMGAQSATASGNRRMSVMPPHAKGLGARTISPTDARRMKRLSVMPQAPPLPQSRLSQAPPTPQPDMPALRTRPTAQSPGLAPRKSITPSSSRTTPDPNRKSYSSGQSLSSSTSYGSTRSSVALPLRLPQGAVSSRLPTPKPRLETGSIINGEEVPPVPAIPKAYESPQSEVDQPFFSARSSSLPPFNTPISESPPVTNSADAMRSFETPRAPSTSSHQSTGVSVRGVESRQKQQQANVIKRNAQSLRLPPLNLLPLSTPTATKIKALGEHPTPVDNTSSTPPPPRHNTKTPSTPMTASKVSFFSRSQRQADVADSSFVRSSTSHHVLRSATEDTRPPSSHSPNLPPFAFEETSSSHRNISPFISSSLPKTSGEFTNSMRPNFGADLHRATTHVRPNGPRAPSFSVTPRADIKASPVESESSFSASALRRKLSRKRSESRNRETAEQDADAAKYDNMPPPKLPASATWSNFVAKSSSPTQKSSYLKSRRKTSAPGENASAAPDGPEVPDTLQNTAPENTALLEPKRSTALQFNRPAAILSAGQNLFAHKSNSLARSSDSSLDRDDMVAEEEMRKLASKRKDFESAARELDGLRNRACPANCMSPPYALRALDLNIFERGEIIDYPDVYFGGTRKAKKIVGDLKSEPSNFGYDDDRGDYNIVEGDHIAYRYEVIDLLGKGSFGQVVRCIDHKTGILVAVKIIRNKKRFHQQALVEVNILQKLREWDPTNKHSVVNFDQSFYFRGHLCISTDLLGMNLYEFIKAHDFKGFSLKLIRRFTKQLLSSLVLLHGHKVIHCDLKPENVLLAHPIHSEIKVIDFGSSCFENEKVYTYIQSRFYRSPEVILGMSYGMPIDMWSLGCILAELFTGYPIFPGENEQEQLACIMEVFGPPEKHLIEKCSRKKLFFDSMGKPRLTVSSKGRRRRPSSKELRQVLKCDDEAFLDFIARCLRWDPVKRMNPHEANLHEFVTGVKMNTNPAKKNITTAANSPIKRMNSVTANGGPRPLPQPPGTSFKNGVVVRHDSVTSSPNKRPALRPTISGVQPTTIAKRASHAAVTASSSNANMSRGTPGQRTLGGRTDLAMAAATASLAR